MCRVLEAAKKGGGCGIWLCLSMDLSSTSLSVLSVLVSGCGSKTGEVGGGRKLGGLISFNKGFIAYI